MNIIDRVHKKIETGDRVTASEALELFNSPELFAIGELAELVNNKKNNRDVYYNINRHINPTNICALSCKFCAFSKKPGDEGAYEYSIDEILQRAGQAVAQGASEVHMVGGLHPRWKFSHYTDMIRAIKQNFPSLHIKALTAVEIDWLSRKARKTIPEVLSELKEAGLDSMPGGGAEIFHPEIRDVICDTKVSADRWIDIHRTAHGLGLSSNCTMLYGHIENFFHRVDHMQRLRDLQDETQNFKVFIPLSFQPFDNDMGINTYTAGFDDLKTIAVARLFLDNFANIKAYWVMLGQDVAQIALNFGANDLDGTVTEEKISRMAGGRAGMVMTQSDLKDLIIQAGKVPVQRDTLYRRLEEKGTGSVQAGAQRFNLVSSYVSSGWSHPSQSTIAASSLPELMEIYGKSIQKDSLAKKPSLLKIESKLTLGHLDLPTVHGNAFEAPFTYNIEFGSQNNFAQLSENHVKEFVSSLATRSSVILTADWIEAFASHSPGTVSEAIQSLKDLGISLVQDIPHTKSNARWDARLRLHKQFHNQDIPSIITLNLSKQDPELRTVDWESFVLQVEELKRQQAVQPGFQGLNMVSIGDTRVSAMEYLKAVFIAQEILGESVPVITPITGMPSFAGLDLSRMSGLTSLKYASLVNFLGISYLGYLDAQVFDIDGVCHELSAHDLDIYLCSQDGTKKILASENLKRKHRPDQRSQFVASLEMLSNELAPSSH